MEDDQRETNDTTSSSSHSTRAEDRAGESVQVRLFEHVKAHKIDVALWVTRLLTILFTIGYLLPLFGNAQSYYNKVLLANAATSALRLHQRLPTITFTREFVSRLFVEDSCHYFLYSLIFLSVSPVLSVLFPVFLFAVLHASSYSLRLLDIIGQNSWWGARFIISIVEFQTTNILRMAAFAEILLMPFAIVYVFTGRAGLMTPFLYYHFLVMRYMSRRNPYTRNVFSELKMVIEGLAARSPQIIKRILLSGIDLVTRIAPQQTQN